MAGQTLYDKVWAAHLVGERKDGNSLIYIDLQLLHEVTSPQAFEGLTLNKKSFKSQIERYFYYIRERITCIKLCWLLSD